MFVGATLIISKRRHPKLCLILCFLSSYKKNITNERSKAMQIRVFTESIRLSVYHSLASLGVPLTHQQNFAIPRPPSLHREIAPTAAPPADHNPGELASRHQCLRGDHLSRQASLLLSRSSHPAWEPSWRTLVFSVWAWLTRRGQARVWGGGQVPDFVHPLVINYLLDPLACAERGASVYILKEASPTRGGETQNRRSRAPPPGSWLSI